MTGADGEEPDDFSAISVDRARIIEERQQRHTEISENLERQAEKPYLLIVDRSEVYYTVRPSAMPWLHVKMEHFRQKLRDHFRAELDMTPYGFALGASLDTESVDQLPAMLYSRQVPTILFQNGRYERKGSASVEIGNIRMDPESIIANVEGTSDIAEAVIQDCLEFLWESAGEPRSFSSLESHVELKRFATVTRADLGVPAESMLSASMVKFLDERMTSEGGFAVKMMPVASGTTKMFAEADYGAAYSVDDINLKVNVFNKRTGQSEVKDIGFSVTRTSDYGTGILTVKTMLPFDEHVRMIDALRDYLSRR